MWLIGGNSKDILARFPGYHETFSTELLETGASGDALSNNEWMACGRGRVVVRFNMDNAAGAGKVMSMEPGIVRIALYQRASQYISIPRDSAPFINVWLRLKRGFAI